MILFLKFLFGSMFFTLDSSFQEYDDIKTICGQVMNCILIIIIIKLLMIFIFILKPRKNGYFHLPFNLIVCNIQASRKKPFKKNYLVQIKFENK